jgi:general secretion pathway protein K
MGQADIAVAFRSEAARIDLNAASKELLAGLIATFGVPRAGAEHYADRIIGWRTPPPKDQDSEASAYRAAGLKYVPRGARFPHVGELALVLDLPVDLIERLAPFVTVYSGRPQVNVLEAAPDVIAALPGMTRDRLHAVLAQRQAAPANGQAMMPLLGPAQGYATMEGAKASRITVQIAFDNGRRSAAEVVILVFEEGEEPYAILSWRDEWDAPRADNGPWTGSQ